MAETRADSVKQASGMSLLLAIVMIVAGFIAILSPLLAGVVIVYVVAWTAIFNGAPRSCTPFELSAAARCCSKCCSGCFTS